jgi:predicted ATPase
MGKTRLAAEAARRQLTSARFPDGIYFVSLAALDDPTLMAAPIADAIGFSLYVRDQREKWTKDDQADQLVAYLRHKKLLLVLDNLEHLLTDLKLLSSLTSSAPEVKILVTSRERLNVRSETALTLQGMVVPLDDTDVTQFDAQLSDAVQLFALCAHRAQPAFVLSAENVDGVITICRLVDGMPLGVELAAAWIGLLTPAEIAAEIQTSLDFLSSNLRDMPERQHSIRAIFDSSWANLSEIERTVFMQLAVFQGGFTRQAAQQVTGATLDTLLSLVKKSLVRPGSNGGYQVHELLRQFAAERLAAVPEQEAAVRERHCAYYVAFLARREAALTSRRQGEVLAEIEYDIFNLRAAWKWAATHERLDYLDQAMESLCEFYRIRGNRDEGSAAFHAAVLALGWQEPLEDDCAAGFEETLDLLDRANIASSSGDRRREVLGRLLARWARFHCESPHVDRYAVHVREDTIQLLSEVGARRELAYVLRYVGHLGFAPWETRELYRAALRTFEEYGDDRGIAETRYRLGVVAAQLGEYREAEELYRASLAILSSGRFEMRGNCFGNLSYVYWAMGDYQKAEESCSKSYDISVSVGYRPGMADDQRQLARMALVRHDYDTARQHLCESLAMHEESGLLGLKAETLGELGHVHLLDGRLAEAEQFAQESLALCDARNYRAGRAEPLIVLGQVACAQRNWRAARSALCEALEVTRDTFLPPYALQALIGVVSLFVADSKIRRAQDIAGFIWQHPATWQWTRDQLAALCAKLGIEAQSDRIEVSRTVRAGDAQRDLWEPIAAIIEQLREPLLVRD